MTDAERNIFQGTEKGEGQDGGRAVEILSKRMETEAGRRWNWILTGIPHVFFFGKDAWFLFNDLNKKNIKIINVELSKVNINYLLYKESL